MASLFAAVCQRHKDLSPDVQLQLASCALRMLSREDQNTPTPNLMRATVFLLSSPEIRAQGRLVESMCGALIRHARSPASPKVLWNACTALRYVRSEESSEAVEILAQTLGHSTNWKARIAAASSLGHLRFQRKDIEQVWASLIAAIADLQSPRRRQGVETARAAALQSNLVGLILKLFLQEHPPAGYYASIRAFLHSALQQGDSEQFESGKPENEAEDSMDIGPALPMDWRDQVAALLKAP
eukprot:TRINITY_DN11606_c0_g1_i1.p1 TRINITY_DN11606_c0_g1~~TRINITY_DN11606_c0_g1_i1.p1  ORF type:complete len:242 (+),score=24.70 TRINITY_DN11606_c0_g1_i1:394-1119(+)